MIKVLDIGKKALVFGLVFHLSSGGLVFGQRGGGDATTEWVEGNLPALLLLRKNQPAATVPIPGIGSWLAPLDWIKPFLPEGRSRPPAGPDSSYRQRNPVGLAPGTASAPADFTASADSLENAIGRFIARTEGPERLALTARYARVADDISLELLLGIPSEASEAQRDARLRLQARKLDKSANSGGYLETLDGARYWAIRWDTLRDLSWTGYLHLVHPQLGLDTLLAVLQGPGQQPDPFPYPTAWRQPAAELGFQREILLAAELRSLRQAAAQIEPLAQGLDPEPGQEDPSPSPPGLLTQRLLRDLACAEARAADPFPAKLLDRQQQREARLHQRGPPARRLLDSLESAYRQLAPFRQAETAYRQWRRYAPIAQRAEGFSALHARYRRDAALPDRVARLLTEAIPTYESRLERRAFAWFLKQYTISLPAAWLSDRLRQELQLTGKDYAKLTDKLFDNSLLTRPKYLRARLSSDPEQLLAELEQDFFYRLIREIEEVHQTRVSQPLQNRLYSLRPALRRYHALLEVATGPYPEPSPTHLDLRPFTGCPVYLPLSPIPEALPKEP